MAIRLAILGCDTWSPIITQNFGEITEQYNHFLRLSQKPFTSKIFDVQKKEFPSNIEDFDGFIITGSKYSAYDNEDWIKFLFEKIRLLDSKKKKLLGVCFGHQAIAQALGGNVQKVGWNLSHEVLKVKSTFSEKFKLNPELRFLCIHQDQVVQVPPETEVWCENEVCKVQGLTKGEHILTIQAHPEFTSEVLKKLLEVKKEIIPAPLLEKALSTVDNPVDSTSFANWVYDFFISFKKN